VNGNTIIDVSKRKYFTFGIGLLGTLASLLLLITLFIFGRDIIITIGKKKKKILEEENKNSITLGNITIHYGKTTLSELLRAGYSVTPNQWKYHAESGTVICGFFKDEIYIGELAFYDVSNMVSFKDLSVRPINLVLPDEEKVMQSRRKGEKGERTFANKIWWTCMLHLGLALFYGIVYFIPPLFSFIQKAYIGTIHGGRIPLGILTMAIPTIIIGFMWRSNLTGKWWNKVIYGLWLMFNVILSLVYLLVIDYYLLMFRT